MKGLKVLVAISAGAVVLAACANASVPVDDGSTVVTVTTATTATDTIDPSGPSSDDSEAPEVDFVPLDLAVGTCFNDPPPDLDEVDPLDIPILGCDTPHDNEVFGNLDIGGVDFPGVAVVQNRADAFCHEAFERYIGSPYESTNYEFSWYFPSAESWPIGGRNIMCFAYNNDLSPITGSLLGIGR